MLDRRTTGHTARKKGPDVIWLLLRLSYSEAVLVTEALVLWVRIRGAVYHRIYNSTSAMNSLNGYSKYFYLSFS